MRVVYCFWYWMVGCEARFHRNFFLFANKGTFLDDLSFSYYFHATKMNQILHFNTLLLLFSSLAILLTHQNVYLAMGVFVCYSIILCALEYKSGFVLATWFMINIVLGVIFGEYQMVQYCCMASWIILPPLQLLGHVVYERRLPAFRAFEALITTPLLMTIIMMNSFGMFKDVMEEVIDRSKQWKTWKQRTF